ncbi:MAG: DUF4082 domain-containing protein [Desulfobaccales bacterium]
MKFFKVFLVVGVLGIALVFAGTQPASADLAAMSFTSAPISSQSQLSLGWAFTTNSAVTVDALGYYAYQGDAFNTPHTVGIFDSLGDLLTSATLSAGTIDPLTGSFRYVSISPLTLAAGQTFVIAATTEGYSDPWAYGNAYPSDGTVTLQGFTVNPAISIGSNAALYYYQSDNLLRDPLYHYSNFTVYAGPNFQAVPLPPSLFFLGSGLLGLLGISKRFKK